MAQTITAYPTQYSVVGSFLLNEINVLFASTDQNYITTTLKKEDGTTIAVLRQSLYNDAAKINIADVLKSILRADFDFNSSNFFFDDTSKYIEFYFDSETANKRIALYASDNDVEKSLIDYVCISEADKGIFTSLMSELKCDIKGTFISAYLQQSLTHSYYLRKENSNNIDNFDLIDMKDNKTFWAMVFFIPFIFGCESSDVSICRKLQYLEDFTFNKINGVSGWTQLDNFVAGVDGDEFSNPASALSINGELLGTTSKLVRQFIPDTKISVGTYEVEILYSVSGNEATNWTFFFDGNTYTLSKNRTSLKFNFNITSISGNFDFLWYVESDSFSGFGGQNTLQIEYISLTNSTLECISDIKKIKYQKNKNEFSLGFINYIGGIDFVSRNSFSKIYEKVESQKISEIVTDGFRKNQAIKRLSEKIVRLSVTTNRKDKIFLNTNLPITPYAVLSVNGSDYKECSILNNSLGDANSYDNYYESEISIKTDSDFFA